MTSKTSLIRRGARKLKRLLLPPKSAHNEGLHEVSFNVEIDVPHRVYGSTNCDWPIIPLLVKGRDAIVYAVGVGANITWDKALIENFDCRVWGFDPTPKTIRWAGSQTFPEKFTFVPIGLADKDGEIQFAAPKVETHVSFSPLQEGQEGGAVSCKVQTLTSLMKDLGHDHVDVLKMDIEGGEYSVIDDILSSPVRPTQLMAEFHHDMYDYTYSQTQKAIRALYDAGYRRYYKSRSGREQAYVYLDHLANFQMNRAKSAGATAAPAAPKAASQPATAPAPASKPAVAPAPPAAAPAPTSSARSNDRGVIFFAFGKPALDEAKLSLRSLRESNSSIPAAVFTDLPETASDFDIVHQFTPTELFDIERYFRSTNRMPSLKVRFLNQSPFRLTIHLDCDTYVKGSLDEFFEALESHHMILTNMPEIEQAMIEGSDRPVHQTLKNLTRPSAFSCAVFGYRQSPETRELLHTWWTQFVEKTAGPKRDKGNWGNTGGVNEQGILHDMLADGSFSRAGVKRGVLPNTKYNAGMTMWPRLKSEGLWDDCRILHSHKIRQRFSQVGVEGLPDLEELQKFA